MAVTTMQPASGAGGRNAVFLRQIDAALRAFAAAAIAGMFAGVLTGGVLGRIAMRITALTAGDADQGRITDAEEIVGVISFDGTFGLIVFVGVFSGFFGGVLYAGARPWLAGLGRWRGLAFGALLLASTGWLVIEHDNFDFHEFGYATLNISMYAAIFLAFGTIVAPAFEWIVRRIPDIALKPSGAAALAARAFGLLGLFGSLGIGVGAGSDIGGWWGLIPAFLLAASIIGIILLSTRDGSVRAPADRFGVPLARSAAAALVFAIAAGAWLDIRAIVHHLAA
jgi:hypothetical protein